MSLTLPRENQNYVTVRAVVAGTFTLPEYAFVTPVDRSAKKLVPSLCFLVEHGHAENKRRVLFDLGLRRNPQNYPSEIQKHLQKRQPANFQPAAPEVLARNGVDPKSINAVVLSHIHWDHHGDPSEFPNAVFYIGHGSLDVLQNGLLGRGSHSHFDRDLFRNVRVEELTAPSPGSCAVLQNDTFERTFGTMAEWPRWKQLEPFDAAFDLFQDGSVFVISAPGHLPGHINLLCKIGPTDWTLLAGDAYHDQRLLDGTKNIAEWNEDGSSYCIHLDKDEAAKYIQRLRNLDELCQREGLTLDVAAAHDNAWVETYEKRCLR